MPLTPAHAAAAWPLSRIGRRLPLDAIVIGTMSPDFEYLLRLAPRGTFGHTLPGLFLFCLPIGLVVWWVFQWRVRPALLTLLPESMGAALRAPRRDRLPFDAAVAILLGALSHIAWDSCTHPNGWVVAHVPVLWASAKPSFLHGMQWFTVLQHASTLVGLALVGWWIVRWVRAQPHEARAYGAGQLNRALSISTALVAVASCGAILNTWRAPNDRLAVALGYAAVGWMDALAVGLLCLGAFTAPETLPAPPRAGHHHN